MTLKMHTWDHREVGMGMKTAQQDLDFWTSEETLRVGLRSQCCHLWRGTARWLVIGDFSSPSHEQREHRQPFGDKYEDRPSVAEGSKCLAVRGPQSRRCSVRNRKKDGVAYWKCECQGKYRTESHSGGETRVKCWSFCRGDTETREAGEKGVGDASSNLRFFIFYGRKYSWVIFSLNTRRVTHSKQTCRLRTTVSLFTSH